MGRHRVPEMGCDAGELSHVPGNDAFRWACHEVVRGERGAAVSTLRALAEAAGWTTGDDLDLCPRHAAERGYILRCRARRAPVDRYASYDSTATS